MQSTFTNKPRVRLNCLTVLYIFDQVWTCFHKCILSHMFVGKLQLQKVKVEPVLLHYLNSMKALKGTTIVSDRYIYYFLRLQLFIL